MSNEDDECIVRIVTTAPALSKPTFVIKVGEKYYATLALWEYDPHALDLTEEQKRGIAEVEHLYQHALANGGRGYEAVEVSGGRVTCSASSTPKRN